MIGVLIHEKGIRVVNETRFDDKYKKDHIGNMTKDPQTKVFHYNLSLRERLCGVVDIAIGIPYPTEDSEGINDNSDVY